MAHTQIRVINTSRQARAMKGRLHGGNSPYNVYPERETYLEGGEYERPDGSRYIRTRLTSRWNDLFSLGKWETRDIPDEFSSDAIIESFASWEMRDIN